MKLNCIFTCFQNMKVLFIVCVQKCIQKVIGKSSSRTLQFAAAISACLLRLGLGASIYWTSPAVPHLTSKNSKFTITPDEASWIVSLFTIGGIIGFLLFPQFIDRIGRKYTMLLFSIHQIASWLLIYFAKNIIYIYIARILSGIGYNAGYVVEIIYIGEIAKKSIRGSLIILGKITFVTGALITVIIGALLSYDNMNLILLFISLLFVLTFPFMPDSPYFYLKMNREEDAFQSLSKLRGTQDSRTIKLEIERMKEDIDQNQLSTKYSLRKLFEMERNRKALLIGLFAILSVELSGNFAVAAYSQRIVSYSGFSLEPKYTIILIVTVVLLSSIIIAPLPDYVGRRILILCYGTLGALGSGTVGLFFFFKFYLKIEDLSSISWIPLTAFAIHIVSCSCGLLSLSQILVAELFSVDVKSSASSLLNIVSSFLGFFVALSFERSVNLFGVYSVFWMFGISCFLLSVINFIIMPETKGKSLEEIQKLLNQAK